MYDENDGNAKEAADALVRRGQFQEAEAMYTEAMGEADTPKARVVVLNNRALARMRLDRPVDALGDADEALALLAKHRHDPQLLPLSAKARYRRATALVALDRAPEAVRAFRDAIAEVANDKKLVDDLRLGLRAAVGALTASYLAGYWADLLLHAEAPNALSSRDGRLLKPVPVEVRMTARDEYADAVHAGFVYGRERESRELLYHAWCRNKAPGKHVLAAVRALAYVRIGTAFHDEIPVVRMHNAPDGAAPKHNLALHQAVKDARAAVAHLPDAPPGGARAAKSTSMWPRAHVALALALEAVHDTTDAALAARRAFERDPEDAEAREVLKRLAKALPTKYRDLLIKQGARALESWLEEERQQKLPEFLRERPKYYYYYEWMRERIEEHYPALPEEVMDKMLTMEAGELDLLLCYPKALQGQVNDYLDVYRANGGEYLMTYQTPHLTWEEVKAMKGAGTSGLGTGYAAPGEGFLEEKRDTNHAMLGASGDGRLTEAERLGLPMATELPPDAARDALEVEEGTRAFLAELAAEGDGDGLDKSTRRGKILAAAEEAARAADKTHALLADPDDLDGVD